MTAVTDARSELAPAHDWADTHDDRGGLVTLWSDALVYAGATSPTSARSPRSCSTSPSSR